MPESANRTTKEQTDLNREKMKDLLLIAEVEDEYGFPQATLYDWRHRGVGPASVRLGRRVYWRRSAIESWIAEQERLQSR